MAKVAKTVTNLSSLIDKYSSANYDKVEMVSTGIRMLDKVLGGGFAPGYCYSFYGEPGAGKTSILLQAVRHLLKQGKKVMILDVEKALNQWQLESFKLSEYVANGQLTILVVGNTSELDDVITVLSNSEQGAVDFLLVDSITSIREVASTDLRVEDVRPGLNARQMSFLLGKMKDGFYRNGICSILIAQARANIEISGPINMYAEKFKMSGGYALRHTVDCIVRVSEGAKIKDDDLNIVGNRVTLFSEKNKFTPPRIKYARNLYYGVGINKKEEVVEEAIEQGIIQTGSAGYYTLPDGTSVRGKDKIVNLPNEKLVEILKLLK